MKTFAALALLISTGFATEYEIIYDSYGRPCGGKANADYGCSRSNLLCVNSTCQATSLLSENVGTYCTESAQCVDGSECTSSGTCELCSAEYATCSLSDPTSYLNCCNGTTCATVTAIINGEEEFNPLMNDDKIQKIQQELKQLSQKQVELTKAYQQIVKSHNELKTFYQHLFGQPPLPSDPELQYVKDEIDSMTSSKQPEKDWSMSPLYSYTLRSWNFDYPPDQLGFYVYTLFSFGIVSKALWRSWNIKKAAEIFKEGVDSAEPGKFDFHMHNSGLTSEKNLARAMASRGYTIGKAFAVAGLIVTGFAAFVQLKNKNRFNK